MKIALSLLVWIILAWLMFCMSAYTMTLGWRSTIVVIGFASVEGVLVCMIGAIITCGIYTMKFEIHQ